MSTQMPDWGEPTEVALALAACYRLARERARIVREGQARQVAEATAETARVGQASGIAIESMPAESRDGLSR